MPLNNLAYRLRGSSRPVRMAVVLGLLIAALASAFVFAQISAGEQRLAYWWPPAGLAASAAIIAKHRELWVVLPVVLVSTCLASFSAQRPLVVAIAGAVGVTAQCWLIRRLAVDAADRPRLFSLTDAGRLSLGAIAGGSVLGALMFAARLTITDVSAALDGALQVSAGTTSAIALIVPFFLISRRRQPAQNVRIVGVSYAATIAAACLAFWPSQTQAFAFIPLPFLAWAAFSLSMSTALVQVIIVNVVALVSTGTGVGPFTAVDGPVSLVAMIEIYVITNTAMCIFIAAVRNERDSNAEQHAAAAALMRQGFARAGNGYIVMRDTEHDTFEIVDINDRAAELTPESLRRVAEETILIPGSDLHNLCLEASRRHGTVQREWTEAAPLSVVVEELPDTANDRVLLVTVIDMSAVDAAAHAADQRLREEQELSERLRQTNEKHDLFVASVTHELRTPLTSIIGYTEEALDLATDDEQRRHLAVIQRNSERLFTLVQDVLATTQPQAPRQTHAPFNLTKVVEDTVDDLRHEANRRGVTLTAFARDAVTLVGSESELRQGLGNLVANAVKFTPIAGTVNISVSCADEGVVVDVFDSGPGMSDDEIDRAFDRFYRSSSAVERGIPGTGLGLGIARDAIEASGGTLVLHRNTPRGLIAHITFPE